MKNLTTGIILIAILLFFCTCKKDSTPTPTVTPLTKTQILAKYNWKIDETFYNINGNVTHYKRGGVNTTGANYDIVRFTFKADGTGTDTDGNGIVHTLTWNFSGSDEGTMQLAISGTPVINATWSLVAITEAGLFQTNATVAGTLETAKLIPDK